MIGIAGYAAIFDAPDNAGDIVRPGAFDRAMREMARFPPLYWQHRWGGPIGAVTDIMVEKRGLMIAAHVDEAAIAIGIETGEVEGLSFGYRARRYRRLTGATRELLDIELIEISVVTHPLHPMATITRIERPAHTPGGIGPA